MAISFEQLKSNAQSTPQAPGQGISFSQLGAEPPPKGEQGFKGFGIGAVKGLGSTLVGAGQLGSKLLDKSVGRLFGRGKATDVDQFAGGIKDRFLTPEGTAENVGFAVEQIGEFFVPASAALKVGRAAKAAATGGRFLKGAAKLGAISGTEGVLGTGQSALQSGKLGKEELGVGAASLIAPPVFAGGGALVRKLIPKGARTKIVEAISKAIRPSMKSRKNPNFDNQAVEAFQLMYKNPAKLSGNVTSRAPRNLAEVLESLRHVKGVVYRQYDEVAKRAGDAGAAFDPSHIVRDLSAEMADTGYSAGIKKYARKKIAELTDLNGVSPVKVQDRIKELNQAVTLFPAKGADKLKNQLDASIANRLRTNLDELILKSTGEPYQAVRNMYRALKSVEDDITRAAAAALRKSKKGFFDITDIFTGGNIVSGVITGNPGQIAAGATGRGIKEYINYVNSPNRNIKIIFRLLEKLK